MPNAVVGTLRAILTLDAAEFRTESARVSESAKTLSRDFKTIGSQATALGSTLTRTITLPLVGLAAGAAKAAIDFESSFAGVRKTVEASESEFAALAQGFRDLSKTIPVNVNELNKLGESAGALGIKKEDILDFSRVMAELGVTTNLTSDQAANAVARIQNIFGAAGKDTERLASTLVALGNAGASTEQEIVEMAQRIAGAGHAVGLTQAQVLSFASTLASVGINAEAGGSAISRIFLKMNDAVQSGGDKLTEFARVAGISASAFKDAFEKDASQATVLFVNGLNRLKSEGENTNATMEGLIGKNIILKDTLNRLAGSGKLLSEQLAIGNKAWQDNNALAKEAQERFKTTASQLQLLWNQIKDVGITLGNALLPAIQSAVSLMGALLPIVDGLAKGFAALPGPIQLGAVGVLGMVAAIGPLLLLIGQLSTASATVTAAFTAKGLVTRFLTADLLLLTAGLRANVVSVMATTTAYGGLGAASVALTSTMRGLWAVMAAHPITAVAAAVGALTLALTKWRQAAADSQASKVLDDVKRLTIARAEQAGILLKSTDITNRYLEAVDGLNYTENRRLGLVERSLDFEKQQLALRVQTGQITQEQANVMLASMQVEEKATGVRKNRISITDAAALAEKQFHEEISATGYSEAELRSQLAKNETVFKAWAKTVGLSEDTVARLKGSIKTLKVETKEAADVAKEAAEAFEKQRQALQALGVVTERDVNQQFSQLVQTFSFGVSEGVPFQHLLTAMLSPLEELAAKAQASGVQVAALTEFVKQARYEVGLLALVKPLDPSIFGAAPSLKPSLANHIGKGGNAGIQAWAKDLPTANLFAPGMVSQSLKTFGEMFSQSLGPTLVQAFTGGGNPTKAVGAMAGQSIGTALVGNFGGAITKTLGATLGGVINGLIPGLGAMLGPLAGKLAGMIGNLFGGEGKKVNNIRDEFLASAGGADELYKKLSQIGRLDLWGPLMSGPGKTKAIEDAIKNIDAALSSAEKTASKYGMSLDSLVPTSEKVKQKSAQLVKDFNELRQSGFSVEQAAKGMAGALNEVIGLAMDSGELLPQALTPLIHQLVDAGLLSEDLAAKLLGVANPVPWQEMEAAAERYGVSVDKLGKQFEQAKFDEATAQIVKDWDLLSQNGEDLGDVMNNMSDEVSELVQKALRLGLTLPASMKPMIDSMFEAGLLVDKNGQKLEDIGQIKFADDLASQFDTLIGKLDAFITKLADLSGLDFSGWRAPDMPRDGSSPDNQGGEPNPPGYAKGTGGRYLNFGAGRLAMLHNDEAVVPRSGSATLAEDIARQMPIDYSAGSGEMRVVFEQDGRRSAEYLAPFVVGEVRRLRLAY